MWSGKRAGFTRITQVHVIYQESENASARTGGFRKSMSCQSMSNKCIGDDTKAAARQSLNCIKNKKKIKYGEKRFSIWRMEFLHPAMWHVALESWQWIHQWQQQCSTPQCDTWLWDDMPLNSPKRPPYWNATSGFHFHTSPQSTCHSVPVILSKSDYPRQKQMTSCRFSR